MTKTTLSTDAGRITMKAQMSTETIMWIVIVAVLFVIIAYIITKRILPLGG